MIIKRFVPTKLYALATMLVLGLAIATHAVTPTCPPPDSPTNVVYNSGVNFTCVNGLEWEASGCTVWCCPGQGYVGGCGTPWEVVINNQYVPCSSGTCAALGLSYPCTNTISCPG